MPWPKGKSKADVAAMSPEERKAAFRGAPATVEVKKQTATVKKETPDDIPPNLFSGQHKSLEVMGVDGSFDDPIPGYYLYWFIDRDAGARLSLARRSGYEFVGHDEVVLNADIVRGNDDLGSHVRKFSKEVIDGKPVYMYLMKKPLHLKKIHDEQMEQINIRNEQEINSGRVSANPQDRQYRPGDEPGSKLPRIERETKLYR